MWIISLFLLLIFAAPSFAQQQNPPVDPVFCGTAMPIVQNQRNTALDTAASAATQLQLANQQIAELKKQIEDLNKKLENPTNAKPPADK